LKGESDKETLTNISEWQQRNIEFWSERWPLPILLLAVLVVETIFTISLFLIGQEVWWIFVTVELTTIAVFFLIIGTLLKWVRKIPVWNGVKNVFTGSISIDALLENKLGVCRDYAKLTACLLQIIYPDTDTYQVFFVHAPQHQATAIMIRNRLPLYVLDRQLPVVTLDKWHERWHENRWARFCEVFTKPWATKNMERIKGDCLESVGIKSYLSKTKSTELDIEKLRAKMMALLSIKEQIDDKASSFEISLPWKKGAKLYEDNEIVNYSLAKRLEMKISSEMIKINQITRIKINRKEDDLTFKICFTENE
jgi:predicted transglutaminase-like protease